MKLEALDDELGPLGPLGDNYVSPIPSPALFHDQPPKPPHKEPTGKARTRPAFRGDGMLDQVALEDEESEEALLAAGRRAGKPPPPVDSEIGAVGQSRSAPPSVPIEQAASPTFEISVGDPHKVGDITSVHIQYAVRTKVGLYIICDASQDAGSV